MAFFVSMSNQNSEKYDIEFTLTPLHNLENHWQKKNVPGFCFRSLYTALLLAYIFNAF